MRPIDRSLTPLVDPKQLSRADARIKEVVGRILEGNFSDLPKLGPPLMGTTGRGVEPGQSIGECQHWLREDRFAWFHKTPPATGPLSGVREDVLRDEFCSSLSTIIGGQFSNLPLPDPRPKQLISWADERDESLPKFLSVNHVPGVGFSVRSDPAISPPGLETLALRLNSPELVSVPALVFAQPGGSAPAGGTISLFVDFVLPQRAVALEFGYVGSKELFEHEEVQLIAFDSAGDHIIVSNAPGEAGILKSDAKAITQPTIASGSVFAIGLRHDQGEIASVELRFTASHPGTAVPFVFRFWHESLPPAAVLQGTIVTEGGNRSFAEFTDPVYQLPEPVDENGVVIPFRTERVRTERLPFRCDRAIVMLRGFKLETLDQTPREVQRIAVEVNPRLAAGGVNQTPGVFRVERGGSVYLEPSGALITRERFAFGYRVHIYFTLVCWDSEQMDVAIELAQQLQAPLQQESSMTGNAIHVSDPCAQPGRLHNISGGVCGPLFGALQGFDFRTTEDQEVAELKLEVGTALTGPPPPESGPDFHTPFHLPREVVATPYLERVGMHVEWRFGSFLSGGDANYVYNPNAGGVTYTRIPNSYSRSVRGAILTGESLVLRTDASGFGIYRPRVGARPPQDFFTNPLPDVPLEGDVAFVGLGGFNFEVDGPIREIEVELKATGYDGRRLQWKAAGGVSTTPWISGGADPDTTDGYAFPLPTFGALTRRSIVARTQLAVQPDVEFNGHVGMLSLLPTQFGAIRNEGNIPALIIQGQISGPHVDEFTMQLVHPVRGASETVFLRDLPSRGPIVLSPGETLLVGGWFFTDTEAGPGDPPRAAFLDFLTNVPSSREIRMNVRGRTSPQDARAEIFPTWINFGIVDVAALRPPRPSVQLISVGNSPVLVHSVTLQDPAAGFAINIPQLPVSGGQLLANGVPYQVDPASALSVEITFPTRNLVGPRPFGPRETFLVFDTNAGIFRAQLRIAGTNT